MYLFLNSQFRDFVGKTKYYKDGKTFKALIRGPSHWPVVSRERSKYDVLGHLVRTWAGRQVVMAPGDA